MCVSVLEKLGQFFLSGVKLSDTATSTIKHLCRPWDFQEEEGVVEEILEEAEVVEGVEEGDHMMPVLLRK